MTLGSNAYATLEMAFATDPTAATPLWTDVTSWWLDREGWSCSMGRANELERFRAGEAAFTLDNSDRRFDPMNSAGPYAALSVTTTLTAAVTTTTATTITVASAASLPTDQFVVTIDSEQMLVTAGFGTTSLTVRRGYAGTTPATHANGATVTWATAGLYPGRRCRVKAWWNLLAAAEGSATGVGSSAIGTWQADANVSGAPAGNSFGGYTSADGDAYAVGWTAAANGTTAIVTGKKAAVARQWYTAAAILAAQSGAPTGQLGLRFYDAAGAVLSTTFGTAVAVALASAGGTQVPAVTVQAPAAAATVALVARVQSATATVSYLVDAAAIYPASAAPASWTAGGGTTLFDGYVEEWPPVWAHPSWSTVTVRATDGFERLAAARLGVSPFEIEMRAARPVHWWRLADPAGTTVLTDHGSSPTTLSIGTNSSAQLGHAAIVAAETASSLGSESGLSGGSSFSAPFPDPTSTTWAATWAVTVNQAPTSQQQMVSATNRPGALPAYEEALRVVIQTSGAIALVAQLSGATATGPNICDGVTHLVTLRRASSTGFTLTVDGVVAGSVTVTTTTDWSAATAMTFSTIPGGGEEIAMSDVAYWTSLSTPTEAALAGAARTPWAGDDTGTRIGRLLDAIGWPAADRSIDVGDTTLDAATTYLGNGALSELQKIEEAEGGALYMTPDGKVRFRRRRAIFSDTRSVTSQATFSDAPAAGEFTFDGDPQPAYDRALVINESRVKRDASGAAEQVATVPTTSRYGIRTRSRSLNLRTDLEARYRASWDVNIYGDARLRVDAMTVCPSVQPQLWPAVLRLAVGDRVTFHRTPPGGGTAVDFAALVEGREVAVDGDGKWTFTYRLNSRETTEVTRIPFRVGTARVAL